MEKLPLTFEMPIGVSIGGKSLKNVTLLRVNGAAEKIFTERLPERPYTWMGYVASAGIDNIDTVPVGAEVRNYYVENNSIQIPEIIMAMPLAEVNSLLVEIHRRIWKPFIPNQECLCKYCGSKFIQDIDLRLIDYSEKDKEKFSDEDFSSLVVKLPQGWRYIAPSLPNGQESPLKEYDGLLFDEFVFSVPTLADAIRNEKVATDTINFWRRIAFDCLKEVRSSEDRVSLPEHAYRPMGLKLYNMYLDGEDLSAIRGALRDSVPTLPLFYEETCPTCHRQTPVVMEGNAFFSE